MNRTILNVSLVLFGVLCGLGISLMVKSNVAQAAEGSSYAVDSPFGGNSNAAAIQKILDKRATAGYTFVGSIMDTMIFKK